METDVIIVGAGLSGATIAHQYATRLNKRVLVIDKRDHIGGNCYDYVDELGILVNKYGAHLFHTNDQDVWNFVQPFATWIKWEHKVVGKIDSKYVAIPVTIDTVNQLYNLDPPIQTEQEMKAFLDSVQIKYDTISNGEEMAKSRVGEFLYDKIFKDYTYKQWGKYPSELSADVLARIPVRCTYDDRYFTDTYQALPKEGYTSFIGNMLDHPNITVKVNTSFNDLDVVDKIIIYTGPIDQYFSCIYEPLEYRSIEFVKENYRNVEFYQSNSVINYPQIKEGEMFTRIVEYKHFLNQKSPHTTIVKEFTTDIGDPYYPVLNEKNIKLYEKYKERASEEMKHRNIHFIGRLANYKYFNMDQAIKNALDYFNQHLIK